MPGGHTNTERGYLPFLRRKILEQLQNTDDGSEGVKLGVAISAADIHPLATV
jgi:hypothetical protein